MAWIKQGLISKPSDDESDNSHLQVPTVLVKDNCLRVYYAGRFCSGVEKGKSYTSFLDLDLNDFKKILYHHKKSIIRYGEPGTFDDEGIMPSEIIEKKEGLYLYYSGWNKRVTIPYHNATGIAVSRDGGASFERIFEGPILDRIATEPYLAVTPSILIENNIWKMWYISGLRWVKIENKFEPVYAIKYATSINGVDWERHRKICIPQMHELEAFSRPAVIKDENIYRMWFCCRDSVNYRDGNGSYRMGYAESVNGIDWQRKDELCGIDISHQAGAWDNKMICYPYIKKINNSLYMFYNGNGFGQSGFGYAKWVD